MLIKYKDAAYNNKIEDLRNNGYTVNFVAFDYDDFVMEEGNPVPFIELQLPNGGKSYKDYSAIVAWSDYLENEDNPDVPTDFDRTHSGMPVPSSFTVQDGDTPVNCYYVIEDTAEVIEVDGKKHWTIKMNFWALGDQTYDIRVRTPKTTFEVTDTLNVTVYSR